MRPPRTVRLRRPTTDTPLDARLPPGQHRARRWPVLQYGAIPQVDIATWELRIHGAVEAPLSLTWSQFEALPRSDVVADMHCVTRWSLLDMLWSGVPFAEVARLVVPTTAATHVLLHGLGGYTANVPLSAMLATDVLLATHANGDRLSPEHGFPVRAVIPNRYAWKSVKWLCGIEFLTADRPGFWERHGYSNGADPWREERFA
jgi:DMSO/TMAO reductase YedYZ molybdopterin-dependent catalytic subunit